MVPANEAEQLILDLVQALEESETVALADCLGRVLASPITSPLDFPHWTNSAMDGYAVRHRDVATAPTTLEIVEEIPAGKAPQVSLAAGQAARLFTGSMLPPGADTVVMQEDTERQGQRVTIGCAPKAGAFVREQGSYRRTGEPLLPSGETIGAPALALLAAAQQAQVPVYRRPRVAILSTGDELVAVDRPLAPGQIVDSNQYALTALVAQAGAVPVSLGRVPDRPEATQAAIAQALTQADLVISSGGVSVGDHDHVDRVLEKLGATIHLRSVAVKPGKPLTVATFKTGGRPILYFGLPGNPVSSLVSFWRFVKPAIRKLSGRRSGWLPRYVWATAAQDLKAGGKRETYLWGQLQATETGYGFEPAAGGHSSGNLVDLALTSGLAIVPLGETRISRGEQVRVLDLSP